MHTRLRDALDYPQDWTLAAELRHMVEEGESSSAGFEFLDDGESQTAGPEELVAQGRGVAAALWDRGLRPGDHVALVLPEPTDFVRAFLGVVWAGYVPVPLFPPLGLGAIDAYLEHAQGIIEASRARFVVTGSRLQNLLWSLESRVDGLEAVVAIDGLFGAASEHVRLGRVRPDDTALLQFTSGSTSRPKGVVVTHQNLAANLHAIVRHGLQMDVDRDSAVSWLPMYHDMGLIGMMLGPLLWDLPTCYLSPIDFVMFPESWLMAISDRGATATFAPNFAYALATKKVPVEIVEELDLSSVRLAGCGAEPIQRKTLEGFIEHFAPSGLRPEALLPAYGMAEATLAMSFIDVSESVTAERVCAKSYEQEGRAVPASEQEDGEPQKAVHEFVCCGRTFPAHNLRIVGDDGAPLGEREVGEIVFEGPSVAAGYFEQPDQTQVTFTEDGLRTGDMGYLSDGDLYVTGRKKDLIIVNGRNIDPQTIEWKAAEVDGVRQGNVVAFSVPGEASEEIVVVAETRRVKDQRKELERGIRRQVSRALNLKVSRILLVDAATLPKTSSGKLQRSKARERYLEGELGGTVRAANRRVDVGAITGHVVRSAANRARHALRTKTRRLMQRLRSMATINSDPTSSTKSG